LLLNKGVGAACVPQILGDRANPRAASHPSPRHGVCCLQSQGPSQTRHNMWHRRCVLFVQWLQDLGVLPCCSGVEQQLLFGRDTACRTPLLVGSLGFSKVVVVQPESSSNRWRHHFWQSVFGHSICYLRLNILMLV